MVKVRAEAGLGSLVSSVDRRGPPGQPGWPWFRGLGLASGGSALPALAGCPPKRYSWVTGRDAGGWRGWGAETGEACWQSSEESCQGRMCVGPSAHLSDLGVGTVSKKIVRWRTSCGF